LFEEESMGKQNTPDFWELDLSSQLLGIGEFKQTNSGILLSLLTIKWSTIEPEWVNSFRLKPISSLNISFPAKTTEEVLLKNSRSIFRTNTAMCKNLTSPIPVEKFITGQDTYWAWEKIRTEIHKKFFKYFQELGTNKTTTLDYLNLQSMGIKDYQKILAKLEGAKPLTIRDRIAYARRYEWIPSVGHGERMPAMTRIKK